MQQSVNGQADLSQLAIGRKSIITNPGLCLHNILRTKMYFGVAYYTKILPAAPHLRVEYR